MRGRAPTSLVLAAVALAGALLNLPLFGAPITPLDEGALLAYPLLVQEGGLPWRDFVTFYGPANPFLLAGVYEVAGATVEVERAVGLLYKLALPLAIAWLLVPRGAFASLAAGLAATVLILPGGIAAAGVLPATTLLVCAIALMTGAPAPRGRAVAAGACLGAAVLFRLDFAIPAALVGGALAWPCAARSRTRLIATAAGVAAISLVAVAAAGIDAFADVLRDVRESGDARRLALPFDASTRALAVWLSPAVAAVSLVVAVRARRDDAARAGVLLPVAMLLLGLLPFVLSRADESHAMLPAAVAAGALCLLWTAAPRATPVAVAGLAAIVAFSGVPTHGAVAVSTSLRLLIGQREHDAQDVARAGRTVPVEAARAPELRGLIDALGPVRPGTRLFVGPSDLRTAYYNDTFLYFLFPETRPASRYLELNPGTANRADSGLREELSSADLLLLTSEYDRFEGRDAAADRIENGLDALVRERFCTVAESGAYRALRRC